jgi:hypothetical protein
MSAFLLNGELSIGMYADPLSAMCALALRLVPGKHRSCDAC